MAKDRIVAVDFETHPIGTRPQHYPPKPVGVALFGDGFKEQYLAWGHPTENNSSMGEAKARLKDIFKSCTVVFHNSSFDIEVALTHLGVPVPESFHDTLFLGFLIDPRSNSLDLKTMAHEYLGTPPRERDNLRDWILNRFPNIKKSDWGAYIAQAPGNLVGSYAKGDVTRTYKLFQKLYKAIEALDKKYPTEGHNMMSAYRREIELMPTLMRMEERGVPLNIKRLERDLPVWKKTRKDIDKWIVTKLGGEKKVSKYAKDGEPFNVGSSKQLAKALAAANLVSHWIKTAKGNPSTAKKNLELVIKDKKLLEAIQRREVLSTYIDTYGTKWLETQHNGCVHPHINQTRNAETEYGKGTRTGRLSYSDSWQAIPSPERRPFPDLPNLREYVIPEDSGRVIAVRDYSQQEFRILAHYESGPLLDRYQSNPFIDMHEEASDMIEQLIGVRYDRRPVKDTGFGLIYGMGLEKLSLRMKMPLDEAKVLKASYLKAIPGLKDLIKEIKETCKRDEPIRTWGGRLYWCEEPKMIQGELRTFEYKMVNVLIQGSAADCTKVAMIRAEKVLHKDSRFLLQVHDELSMTTPKHRLKKEMAALREAMESVEFDVKMLSDGKTSPHSWGKVTKYNDMRKAA